MERRGGYESGSFEELRKDINLPSVAVLVDAPVHEVSPLRAVPLTELPSPLTGEWTIEDVLRGHKVPVFTKDIAGIGVSEYDSTPLIFETSNGILEYNTETGEAVSPFLENPVRIRKTEGKILKALMTNSAIVHTPLSLCAAVFEEMGGDYSQAEIDAVVMHIGRLRKRLGDTRSDSKASGRLIYFINNGYSLTDPNKIVQEYSYSPTIAVRTPNGVLKYHPERHQAISPLLDEPVIMTNIEGEILKILMDNPTISYSASDIYAAVFKEARANHFQTDSSVIKAHIANIRRKLGDTNIGRGRRGIRGILIHHIGGGYSLTDAPIKPVEAVVERPPMVVETPHGPLKYYPDRNHQVVSPLLDSPVNITAHEGKMLAFLMGRPVAVHTREDIYYHMYDESSKEHSVDPIKPHIFKLRRKLGDVGRGADGSRRSLLIHHVRNIGYSLTPRYPQSA